jgi:hypothetical protein
MAGSVAGLAIHLLLTVLGIGLGLGVADPMTEGNPVAKFGMGATIAWGVSALIALWSGGWVAGKAAPAAMRRSGCLHGFLVWSVATVAVFVFATSTAGMMIGGAAKIVSQSFQMAAKPVTAVAAGSADIAKETLKQNSDVVGSYLDEVIQSRGENAGPGADVRAKREIGYALTRLFSPGGDANDQEKRAAVIRAMTEAGVSEADANRMLTEWTASYERMKTDLKAAKDKAEQKAREAGEVASKALSRAAVWTFLAFLLGAIVASLGGMCGSCCNAVRVDDVPRRV